MKLDFPNRLDSEMAEAGGRTWPGSNIFIHGKAVSIGCLAMGDCAIEELFVLTADTGLQGVSVIIAPNDPGTSPLVADDHPPWVTGLYAEIKAEFFRYRESGQTQQAVRVREGGKGDAAH